MSTGYESYQEGFRRRREEDRRALLAAREQARAAAERAAVALLQRFGLGRVLLIGSVQRGSFRPGSDIDLAVEGLPPGALEEAERVAREAAGLPVDVLRLEAMSPSWRAHHERFGEAVDAGR